MSKWSRSIEPERLRPLANPRQVAARSPVPLYYPRTSANLVAATQANIRASNRSSVPPARHDLSNTETRMRQALGLEDRRTVSAQRRFEPPKQRRRFAKDGEAPVVVRDGRSGLAGSLASRIAAGT